ncbi:hypothetical protein [Amycolatopsis sp. DSM 110486]|uniref:hypothetical protein n=1 Tax=Amycolatopsis sp. DSM 110486 TaxID=2865832 RepID=UPI001C6A89AF|nr:hypothetical protein [Amycolatopsis sp. DSM 110486]QYN24288.1 hypothetical protein K1T34_18690 [Amycolatopsis sp. DSM 110486]
MSWQEELRRLDEELASGRLSADDYRIRRDQVLSSAVGQQDQPAPQQAAPSADSTQIITPVSPPQGMPQQPQQQPPQQQQQPPAAPQQPAGDPSAERTQAVQSWQMQQHADPARTEYVQPQQQPPQAQYSPPGGFQQPASPAGGFPQQQPWNAPEGDQSPPWGGGELPPLGPSGNDSFRQGPEFFAEKPKSGSGKKVGAIVGAVVVLAAIAFGAYWLWGRDSGGGNEQPTAQPTQQAPSSAPKPPDPLAVANMPGKAETHDDITSFSEVNSLSYLNPDELEAYQAAGASKAKFVVYHLDNGDQITLLLTQASSPTAAATAADKLMQIQVTNGAKRDTAAPDGVFATTIDKKDGQSAQERGHYAHGNVIVRIDVSGKGDLSTVKADFSSALNQQLTTLPADA